MQHVFTITGMTCSRCAIKVQEALENIPEITQAVIDIETDTATITMKTPVSFSQMNTILSTVGPYVLTPKEHLSSHPIQDTQPIVLRTYWPLILVFLYIIVGTLHLGWVRGLYNMTMTQFVPSFSFIQLMPDFMGLFFVAFAFFKLLDLKGFATSYRGYDIITKQWPTWGYIYPFVELALGMCYLHGIAPLWTNVATLVVMSFSIVGVIQSVLQNKKIKCVCLGTGFNLPMSTVTIIEDGLMILMALWGAFTFL